LIAWKAAPRVQSHKVMYYELSFMKSVAWAVVASS
jgi:hypothetical protein